MKAAAVWNEILAPGQTVAVVHSRPVLKMDIIRRKIYNLKKETVDVVNRVLTAEKDAEETTEAATESEKKIRELMKTVSKKENELDVMQDKLDATEKKIRVADSNLKRNKDDVIILNDLIVQRQNELHAMEEDCAQKSALLTDATKR